MAGNSQRRGAIRKSRKGPSGGTGGYGRKRLEGKGPTPKAEDRTGHPAARRKNVPDDGSQERSGGAGPAGPRPGGRRSGGAGPAGARSGGGRSGGGGSAGARAAGAGPAGRSGGGGPTGSRSAGQRSGGPRGRGGRGASGVSEYVAGRNSVVEALRADVPATALYLQMGLDNDRRVTEAVALATERGYPLLEGSRTDLDRLTDRAVHQGLALKVPPYAYAHPDDLLTGSAGRRKDGALTVVALDRVTDPRNLGAVVRSAAAFGAAGVVVPERRSAGMTAGAWKASAGAAARLPVARAVNLSRTLTGYAEAGLTVVGLDAEGDIDLPDLDVAGRPVCLVVGAEEAGLSRLVRESCDIVVSIPMRADTESLNAGVAAGIALYALSRQR